MKFINEYLNDIKDKGLYRNINVFDSPQSRYVFINNRKVLLMASNNYLDLCNDERLKNAAKEAVDIYGVGSGGSRLTTGTSGIHEKLEKKIAEFKGTESAILFNTGYMANVGTIAGMANKEWIVFSDELNHASIIDGCRLSGAKIIVYKHCDVNDLKEKVMLYQGSKRLIVTDGVFSMDGDIAPLDKIVELAKKENIITMVDDAHGTGVLGDHGGGAVDYFNLKEQVEIQVGTLSKALASEGGFVAGSKELTTYLRHKARSFVYSTALSPVSVAVSLCALDIVNNEKEKRIQLLKNSKWFQEELRKLGFNILESNTAIIAVIIGNTEKTMEFTKELLQRDIFVSGIRYPTVAPNSSRLRMTLMATHNKDELRHAIENIKEVGIKLDLI